MKFKKYINESDDYIDTLIDDVIKVIESDCKPYIKDWQKLNTSKWLMSGRKDNIPIIKKKSLRKNRKPVDTPLMVHDLMDDWFNKKFGVKSRSNAIFCSFNPNLSDYFGKLHLVFPIGKYKAVSSEHIKDVYDRISDMSGSVTGKNYFTKSLFNRLGEDEVDEILNMTINLLKDSLYTDKLTFHNNEVMLTCKEFYILNADFNGPLLDYFGE